MAKTNTQSNNQINNLSYTVV